MRIFCFLFLFVLSLYNAHSSELPPIKVALYLDPPSSDFVNNEFVGRNVELAKLLANSLGREAVFVSCPFLRCLTELKLGRCDMMVSLKHLAERESYLSYVYPPFKVQNRPLLFYTLDSSNVVIEKYEDLYSLKVGVVRGSSYFYEFDNDERLNKLQLTSHEQLIKMLMSNRIDVFVEREESVKPWVSGEDYEKLRVSNYQYSKPNASYIVVSKKSLLNDEIDLISMKLEELITNGSVAYILSK